MQEFLAALKTLCACFCLFGLGMAGLEVGAFLDRVWPTHQASAPAILRDAKDETLALVDTRLRLLQENADQQITATRKDLSQQITSTRRELLTEVNGERQDLMHIAGKYADLADKHATRVEAITALTAARVGQSLDGVDAVTDQSAGFMKQVNEAAPMYLDCDSGACLFNQIYSTSTAVKKTAETVAKHAPGVADDFHRVSDKFTAAVTGPKSTKQKFYDALMITAAVARVIALF